MSQKCKVCFVTFFGPSENPLFITDHQCHVLLSYPFCMHNFTALYPSSICVLVKKTATVKSAMT